MQCMKVYNVKKMSQKQHFRRIYKYNFFKTKPLRVGNVQKTYKAMDRQEQKFVQLIKLNKLINNEKIQNTLKKIVQLDFKNLVKYKEYLYQQSRFYLITKPYGDSLMTYINNQSFEGPQKIIQILKSIIRGMIYLEKEDIKHKYLNPNNIIFTKTQKCLLSNYGIVELYESTNKINEIVNGQFLHYISPEILQGNTTQVKSGIWSLGIILAEILYGKNIFNKTNHIDNIIKEQKLIVTKLKSMRSKLESTFLNKFLFDQLLIYDHQKRKSWKQLIKLTKNFEEEYDIQNNTLSIQNQIIKQPIQIETSIQQIIKQPVYNQIIKYPMQIQTIKQRKDKQPTINYFNQQQNFSVQPIKKGGIKIKTKQVQNLKNLIKIKTKIKQQFIVFKQQIQKIIQIQQMIQKTESIGYVDLYIDLLILKYIQKLKQKYIKNNPNLIQYENQFIEKITFFLKKIQLFIIRLQINDKYNKQDIEDINGKNLEQFRLLILRKWKLRKLKYPQWTQKMKYFQNKDSQPNQ